MQQRCDSVIAYFRHLHDPENSPKPSLNEEEATDQEPPHKRSRTDFETAIQVRGCANCEYPRKNNHVCSASLERIWYNDDLREDMMRKYPFVIPIAHEEPQQFLLVELEPL